MAKPLQFNLSGTSFALAPVKLERRKLYGWTELRATTPEGEVCRRAGLDPGASTIVPNGAVKSGMLRQDGLWMEKEELITLTADGTEAQMRPSSFEGEITLTDKATPEELLDHNITSVYQLEEASALAAALGQDIYRLAFSYRGGYELAPAFLLAQGENAFLLVGERVEFAPIGLEEQGTLDDEEPLAEEESDELDFSMF